jgi:hypothetical protein
MTGWHLDDDALRRYVERADPLAEGASVEQHLLSCGRAAAGPARCRADRPQDHPPRRDREIRHAGVPLRDVQEAASHADPRTTMRYDRARGSLDRHATYIVAAYIASAAR